MYPARIDRQGRTVVPRAVRDAMGVKPGEVLFFLVGGGQVRLARSPGSLEEYKGLFGGDPVDDFDADDFNAGAQPSSAEEDEGDDG